VFLLTADNGVLFLDEIGELGLEEQAMLLHAIENKSFHPVGSDKQMYSNFQLIAGTNRNLQKQIAALDDFDIAQLGYVLNACQQHRNMACAGRALFNVSRTLKAQPNDSSRLQKYLAKFGLKFSDINA
jgi:sigma54-dependent transcription regulator